MISFTILLFSMIVGITSAADVPEFIHICKQSDPDFNDCLTESILHIRPYLVTGIPEFNVPALEPLYLEELVAMQGSGIKISATDIKAYGSSDFTVENMKLDSDLVLTGDVSLPHLYVEGMYNLDGKILLLPISGAGPMQGNFTEITASIRLEFELKKNEQGIDHLYCAVFEMKMFVGKGNINFENLFGGERVLGDVVNTAINANFDIFVKELGPLIEKSLCQVFKDIANNIVKPFSYNQLLVDG